MDGNYPRYLRGNRHVAYASEPLARARYEDYELTGCQLLAQWLQVQATFAAPSGASRSIPSDPLLSVEYRDVG